MRSVDLQDVLLMTGLVSLCTGVGLIYLPASVILFGVLCLFAVFLIERAQKNSGK